MEITTNRNENCVFLSLCGRLNAATAQELHVILTGILKENTSVELDFTEITYVSSAGLRVLLFGMKSARMLGKSMTLRNVSPEVMEVFEITGFPVSFEPFNEEIA